MSVMAMMKDGEGQSLVAVAGDNVAGALGHLLMGALDTKMSIPFEDVDSKLRANGLDKYIPRRSDPGDVFRKATTRGAKSNTFVIDADKGLKGILRIEPVGDYEDNIVRKAVLVLRNEADVDLEFYPVVTFTFNKNLKHWESITHDFPYKSEVMSEVEDLVGRVHETYDKYNQSFDSEAIRRVMYRVLTDAKAFSVNPSGQKIFFVLEKHKEALDSLIGFLGDLGLNYYSLPLMDSKQARADLSQMLITETEETVLRIGKIMKEPNLGGRRLSTLLQESAELADRLKEVGEYLETNKQKVESRLGLLQNQIKQMIKV